MNIDAKLLNRNPANQAQDLIKVSSAMFKLASYQKYKDSLIYVNQKCNSPHKHIEEKKPHHLLRKGHQKNIQHTLMIKVMQNLIIYQIYLPLHNKGNI